MVYARRPGQSQADYADTGWEDEIRVVLGEHVIDDSKKNDRLDFWVPGFYLECKEKRQPLTTRWHLLPGVPEENLFVLDELSVRRAMRHGYEVFYAIKDRPTGRTFLAAQHELIGVDRVRVNRNGKGKWIINLGELRLVDDISRIPELIREILSATPWKRSDCISLGAPVPEV